MMIVSISAQSKQKQANQTTPLSENMQITFEQRTAHGEEALHLDGLVDDAHLRDHVAQRVVGDVREVVHRVPSQRRRNDSSGRWWGEGVRQGDVREVVHRVPPVLGGLAAAQQVGKKQKGCQRLLDVLSSWGGRGGGGSFPRSVCGSFPPRVGADTHLPAGVSSIAHSQSLYFCEEKAKKKCEFVLELGVGTRGQRERQSRHHGHPPWSRSRPSCPRT